MQYLSRNSFMYGFHQDFRLLSSAQLHSPAGYKKLYSARQLALDAVRMTAIAFSIDGLLHNNLKCYLSYSIVFLDSLKYHMD